MKTAQEYTKMYSDMMSRFPADPAAYSEMFRKSAEIGGKFATVALKAAESNAEVTNKWVLGAIEQLKVAATAQDDPKDYTKVANSFASASMEMAAEHLAAYTEVAKDAQIATSSILLDAGK